MATATVIDRLTRRIDEIAAVIDPAVEYAIISAPVWLDREAVVERHMSLFPESRNAKRVILLTEFGRNENRPFGYNDSKKIGLAWRQIAREETAALEAAEVRRVRGQRELNHILAIEGMAVGDRGAHVGDLIVEYGIRDAEARAALELVIRPEQMEAAWSAVEGGKVWAMRHKASQSVTSDAEQRD